MISLTKKIFISLLFLGLAIVFIKGLGFSLTANMANAQTSVTTCGTLSTPGETYLLANSIPNVSGTCFTIAANNVTLDGAGRSITGSGTGSGVLIQGYNNITVKNLNIKGFEVGITLQYSTGSTLSDNTTKQNNYAGILVYSSSDNLVTGNTSNSNDQFGIAIEWLGGNTVKNNTVSFNAESGINIIGEGNNSNKIIGNTINSNGMSGLDLRSSNGNVLSDNTVSGNDYGIYLDSSGNNQIYNNFLNNTANFYFKSTILPNTWNTALGCLPGSGQNIIGGDCMGGNYWANPSGTGFSETCTDANSDGICDSSYTLAEGNIDKYPLTMPPPPPPPPVTSGNFLMGMPF